jgi:hypothetical protein
MNGHRSHLYLAHSSTIGEFPDESGDGDYAASMEREDAAEYIAALLGSLRDIAAKAKLRMLSDLIYVAEEEAKLNSRAQAG